MQILRPLEDKIVIKPINPPKVSKGGIILPETATDVPDKGQVVAVGEGKFQNGDYAPMKVKVGDTVLFPKMTGYKFPVDGEEFYLFRYSDLIAVLEDTKKRLT